MLYFIYCKIAVWADKRFCGIIVLIISSIKKPGTTNNAVYNIVSYVFIVINYS